MLVVDNRPDLHAGQGERDDCPASEAAPQPLTRLEREGLLLVPASQRRGYRQRRRGTTKTATASIPTLASCGCVLELDCLDCFYKGIGGHDERAGIQLKSLQGAYAAQTGDRHCARS